MAIYRAIGDRRSEGRALGSLARVRWALGARGRAREHLEGAVGERRSEGIALGNLGELLADRGRLREALAVARGQGDARLEASALEALAALEGPARGGDML